MHAGQPVTTTAEQSFSAAAMRELKGSAPVDVEDCDMQGSRLSEYAEAKAAAEVTAAEMQGRASRYAEARSVAAIRELKGSAPTEPVDDVLVAARRRERDRARALRSVHGRGESESTAAPFTCR